MPGGAVIQIPDSVSKKIMRFVSAEVWDEIRFAADCYCLTLQHVQQPGRALRDNLSKIADRASELRRDILCLREEGHDALRNTALSVDAHQWLNGIVARLAELSNYARVAHNSVNLKEGKPPSDRQSFVRGVARIMINAGYVANAKPNGALCQIVSLVLTEYENCPVDVRALVANALRENPPTPR